MEGKLGEKTGKLMKGLGSGKALNGSKLWALRQLAAEPQEQEHTCRESTKRPQKNNYQPFGPETVRIMG